jgi:hypothetical protein
MADNPNEVVNYDQLDSEGRQFAAAIDPQMEQLLQSAAGLIEAIGAFTALLNNAGQVYAQADYNSDFTAVPTVTPVS